MEALGSVSEQVNQKCSMLVGYCQLHLYLCVRLTGLINLRLELQEARRLAFILHKSPNLTS